jgi:hypothetical protein
MNESNPIEEGMRLVREIESLEQGNKTLAKELRDLESRLLDKKKEAKTFLEDSEEQKKGILEFAGKESDLVQEIEFYESEKRKLDEIYAGVSARYDLDMSVLEGMIKDVGFMKGEIGALIMKMGMLEEEIPDRFRDADNLDKKIKGTFIRALNHLQNRIDVVERNAKVLYYKKEDI